MTMQGAFLSQVTKPGDTVWAPTQPVPRCCPAGCGAGLEVEVMFPALQPSVLGESITCVYVCGREGLLIWPEELGVT